MGIVLTLWAVGAVAAFRVYRQDRLPMDTTPWLLVYAVFWWAWLLAGLAMLLWVWLAPRLARAPLVCNMCGEPIPPQNFPNDLECPYCDLGEPRPHWTERAYPGRAVPP